MLILQAASKLIIFPQNGECAKLERKNVGIELISQSFPINGLTKYPTMLQTCRAL